MTAKKNNRGQIALIMILLSAAALIFLSITLNWGRIAQIKTMLSIAADQGAAMLASDVASYGEMEKQTNLNDTNEISALSGIILDLIMVVVAIVVLIITICSMGTGSAACVALVMAIIAVIAAVAVLVLQLTVIQPGMCALWNKLQKNQPIQQQFYEGGVGAALQGAVTDQVNLTDYFDENTNGMLGLKGVAARDTVSRFGFFYTERLKMLNKADNPYIGFFYNQLTDFMNGESCLQNFVDSQTTDGKTSGDSGIPLNPSCIDPGTGTDYCGNTYTNPDLTDPACEAPIPSTITCAQNAYEHHLDPNIPLDLNCPTDCYPYPPTDLACQMKVSNQFGFLLNDPCADTGSGSAVDNPYCDACCQPMVELVKAADGTTSPPTPAQYKSLRPSSCYPYTSGYPTICAKNPNAKDGSGNGLCDLADLENAGYSPPPQCTTNNPFGAAYPYIYDPSYQQYANQKSFLDRYGRDQQMEQFLTAGGTSNLTPEVQGSPTSGIYFPNGIYPFFWLMDYYSPQVDNITVSNLTVTNAHWCANTNYTPPPSDVLAAFPGLTPLSLSYSCNGADCCVEILKDSTATVSGSSTQSTAVKISVGTAATAPKVTTLTISGSPYYAGGTMSLSATATETSTGGSIDSIGFSVTVGGVSENLNTTGFTYNPPIPPDTTPLTFFGSLTIPACSGATPFAKSGTYKITATALDPAGNSGSKSSNITITNPNYCLTASASVIPCGTDGCSGANDCGPACSYGENCTMTAPATTAGKCECSDGKLVPNVDDCSQCNDICANGTTCHHTGNNPGTCLCSDNNPPSPTDPNHCGNCATKCSGATPNCSGGVCGP